MNLSIINNTFVEWKITWKSLSLSSTLASNPCCSCLNLCLLLCHVRMLVERGLSLHQVNKLVFLKSIENKTKISININQHVFYKMQPYQRAI